MKIRAAFLLLVVYVSCIARSLSLSLPHNSTEAKKEGRQSKQSGGRAVRQLCVIRTTRETKTSSKQAVNFFFLLHSSSNFYYHYCYFFFPSSSSLLLFPPLERWADGWMDEE